MSYLTIETGFVFGYLAVVLYIGIFAFRRRTETGEDYFLASRSLGTAVFFLSLFGTHMTAFAILGSSGRAFKDGIGVYGLMASSSAIVVPVLLALLGPRLWDIGRRHGHKTPVQIFRGRWEAGHLGTLIFALQAALLVPYIILGVKGGGTALTAVSAGAIPEWFGGGLVALVMMSYVFFGGMRGTAWVNTLQTSLFLLFGLAAFFVVGQGMGGLGKAVERMLADPTLAPLLSRERMPQSTFVSFLFIPLSALAFPHMCILCLTARKPGAFRKSAIFYPLCILLVWFPCVLLGTIAAGDSGVREALAASGGTSDEVMVLLLREHAPAWLAGLLGAGILAAVMASDSQILALSTMFTEDILVYYFRDRDLDRDRAGGRGLDERTRAILGRAFVVGATLVAYWIAMTTQMQIFEIGIQFAFTGYAAMLPVVVAAAYWKRSSRHGVLASILVVIAGLLAIGYYQWSVPPPAPGTPPIPIWTVGGIAVLERVPPGLSVLGGYLPVVPLVLLATLALIGVSLLTRPPSRETIDRYFP